MPLLTAPRTSPSSWSRWYPHVDGFRAGRTDHAPIDEPTSIMAPPAAQLPPHEAAAVAASAPRRLLAAALLFVVALLVWISSATARAAAWLTPKGRKRAGR